MQTLLPRWSHLFRMGRGGNLHHHHSLAWLICSILQYMALHDGPCHATLSTTSSMPRKHKRSMDSGLCTWSVASSRRKHLGTCPGGLNHLSGMAQSLPLRAKGQHGRHQHGLCFSAGLLCVLLYLALSGLGHQRISTARSSTPSRCASSFLFGLTRPHVRLD